ncbi:MAG: GTPase [Fimbriimonadia bacterium]
MSSRVRRRVVIMGAAGRDFHVFNMFFRGNEAYEVVAFTATQIPNIEGRVYPAELAGDLYPNGIPIHPEEELPELVRRHQVDEVVFAYSDIPHLEVMHKASLALSLGPDFRLCGADSTMLRSSRPVIAVCAVRTGCGKSQVTRALATALKEMGLRTVAVRHPMPYGDLRKQVCQRFESIEDLKAHDCTIEEMEEYEPHIAAGHVVYAGVDYEEILRNAEQEADVILWDGGNNDVPFFRPSLMIVVADPHRPGHEMQYHPGETNLRMADVVVVSKTDTAPLSGVEQVEANVRAVNPKARILRAKSPVSVPDPSAIRDKSVLLIEDGPTVTHGEMSYGAAYVAAKKWGAGEPVDPRPYAVGTIKATFEKYPHLEKVLPAMGYGERQIADLEQTIAAVPCELVLIGTPIDLSRVVRIEKPAMRVKYELDAETVSALRTDLERTVQESRMPQPGVRT